MCNAVHVAEKNKTDSYMHHCTTEPDSTYRHSYTVQYRYVMIRRGGLLDMLTCRAIYVLLVEQLSSICVEQTARLPLRCIYDVMHPVVFGAWCMAYLH